MSYSFKNFINTRTRGFTLAEMMVSISIIVVILTVVLSNQSTYTDGASVNRLADEIGLSISEAQAYGIGVRQLSPGSDDFSASYGIAFSLIQPEFATSYIFFADTDADLVYGGSWDCPDTGSCGEYQNKTDITGGNSITSICEIRDNDTEMCSVSRVDVSFVRPDTTANIMFFNNGGSLFSPQPSNIKGAKIVVTSPKGTEKNIIIYKTGQVSIQ